MTSNRRLTISPRSSGRSPATISCGSTSRPPISIGSTITTQRWAMPGWPQSWHAPAAAIGILLDTEAYQGKLFDYRKRRNTGRRTAAEYAIATRCRGAELITAFQEGYPGLTVLLTFGDSLVWRQSDHGKKPLADCPDGLLVAFIDGMIEAAKQPARLIDGHEMSYGYRDPAAFASARDTIKVQAAALSSDRAGYARFVTAAFGIWLDHDWRKHGWKPDQAESNYFSPERLETSLPPASSSQTSMSGSTAKNRGGGRKRVPQSICRPPTSRPSGEFAALGGE